MPEIYRKPALVSEFEEKRALLGHGDGVAKHRHTDGQLLYPSAGVLATTTERGTWVAPANRVACAAESTVSSWRSAAVSTSSGASEPGLSTPVRLACSANGDSRTG